MTKPSADPKAERLAAALRENLHKRKARMRAEEPASAAADVPKRSPAED